MINATESFNPTICGPDDDVVEKNDDGIKTYYLRDWTKPPQHLRCECQKMNTLCKCGVELNHQVIVSNYFGTKTMMLTGISTCTYTSITIIFRFLFIPGPIYETFYKYMIIR